MPSTTAPSRANNDQSDVDQDGIGDVCEDPCGNGGIEPGEECDDANSIPDDGCNNCRICGNGTITSPEECDDTALADGDGCSAACEVEECWQCTGAPSICTPDDLDTLQRPRSLRRRRDLQRRHVRATER